MMSTLSSSSTSSVSIANSSTLANAHQKEAWPSLSISPINSKETLGNASNMNGKSRKEKSRSDKARHDKNKNKNKSHVFPNANTSNKENFIPDTRGDSSSITIAVPAEDLVNTSTKIELHSASNRLKSERNKEKESLNHRASHSKGQNEINEEIQKTSEVIEQLDKSDDGANSNKEVTKRNESNIFSLSSRLASNVHRSLSSSSENSDDHLSESSTSEQSSPANVKIMRCNSNETHTDINHSNVELVNSDDILSTTKTANVNKTYEPNTKKRDEITQSKIQDDIEILNIGGIDSIKEVSGMLFPLTKCVI